MVSVFWLAEARPGKRKKGPKAAAPAATLRKLRREVVLAAVLIIWVPRPPPTLSSTVVESAPLAGQASQGWKEQNRVVACPATDLWGLLAELTRLLQAS